MVLYVTNSIKSGREGNYRSIRRIVNLPEVIANDIVGCFGITNVLLGSSEGNNSDRFYVEFISKDIIIEYKKDKITITNNNEKNEKIDPTVYSIQIVNPFQEIEEGDD